MLNRIRNRIVAALCSMLDNFLEDHPEHADAYLRLAKLKYRTKNFEGAIRNLEIAVKHDPTKYRCLLLAVSRELRRWTHS